MNGPVSGGRRWSRPAASAAVLLLFAVAWAWGPPLSVGWVSWVLATVLVEGTLWGWWWLTSKVPPPQAVPVLLLAWAVLGSLAGFSQPCPPWLASGVSCRLLLVSAGAVTGLLVPLAALILLTLAVLPWRLVRRLFTATVRLFRRAR